MLCQRSTELAIRATLFLAQQAPGKLSPVHEIAAHMGASEAYLAKIMQRLTSAGLVRSFRGPGKGMELSCAPGALTLESVRSAMEGPMSAEACVLGFGVCSEKHPCALHREWLPIRTAIHELLEKTTLADLLATIEDRAGATANAQRCKNGARAEGAANRGRRRP
jgi:Rrf2 family protein